MNIKLKILQIGTNIVAVLWLSSSVLTIGSIYLSTIGMFINITIGIIFLMISVFYFEKQRRLYILLSSVCQERNRDLCKKVISLELIGILLGIFFASIVIFAIIHRVFYEGFAVFG